MTNTPYLYLAVKLLTIHAYSQGGVMITNVSNGIVLWGAGVGLPKILCGTILPAVTGILK